MTLVGDATHDNVDLATTIPLGNLETHPVVRGAVVGVPLILPKFANSNRPPIELLFSAGRSDRKDEVAVGLAPAQGFEVGRPIRRGLARRRSPLRLLDSLSEFESPHARVEFA